MSKSPSPPRPPGRYLALAVGTIALGLAVHLRGGALSPVVRDVGGDALWAAMVVWGIAAVAPAMRRPWRAALALALCVVVEFSQLVHFPALDALRRTTAGHLALGSGFDPAISPRTPLVCSRPYSSNKQPNATTRTHVRGLSSSSADNWHAHDRLSILNGPSTLLLA